MVDEEDLIQEFSEWLSRGKLKRASKSNLFRLWYTIGFWVRPVNVTRDEEVDGRELDLYYEIPMNFFGLFLKRLRYRYGIVRSSDVKPYIDLDLTGIVFVTSEPSDEALEAVEQYNRQNSDRRDYWNRQAATIFDTESQEIIKPEISTTSIFETFLRDRNYISEE